MEVTAEAKQIMVQALGKIYSLRTQRGGLPLHRSLLLTLVMKTARDIYHSARLASEKQTASCIQETTTTTRGTDEGISSCCASPLQEISAQVTGNGQRSDSDELSHPHCSTDRHLADKENSRTDRQSRKRRSMTATDPDFLPCKKAKLEVTEACRNLPRISANCSRALDSMSLVPAPITIVSF